MFRVIGKILIFIFSVFLVGLGGSELVYLFVQYINILDPLHIALSAIQGVLSLATGVIGLICITRSKNTNYLIAPYLILLGLGIYYLVIANNNAVEGYYLALGIINVVSNTILLLSTFWNRGR